MKPEVFNCKIVKTKDTNGAENGYIQEMLHINDFSLLGISEKFGQFYLAVALPGTHKGFHLHDKKTEFFTIVSGKTRIVVYDYDDKKFYEFEGDENNPITVKIRPGQAHGFKAIGDTPSFVINYTDVPYDPKDPEKTVILADYRW